MGIRIHKLMGYGLDDLKLDEEQEIADPRLRTNVEKSLRKPLSEYGTWLHARREANPDALFVGEDAYRFPRKPEAAVAPITDQAREYITLLDGEDIEDGEPGILLIRPYGYKEWTRYDDSIDYVEHQLNGYTMAPHVQRLPFNPYPHEGNHRYRESGEYLRSPWINDMNRALREGDDKTASIAAQQMGFRSTAEYQLSIYQAPPMSVEELAIWSGIFKDPATARFLKPMILTYWR